MKPVIAHLNECFFNPSETFIYNYIHALKGFQPILVADNLLYFEFFSFKVKDAYLRYPPKYTYEWVRNAFIRTFLATSDVREHFIKKRNAKIMHAHFGPNGYRALSLKRKLSIPLITSFYGYDASAFAGDLERRRKYAELFETGDMFLVEGEYMKGRLLRLGCPQEKIRVQRIAIPVARIEYTPKMRKNAKEKTTIVFAGRFVEKKGVKYALEALGKVRKQGYGFEFRLVGDGPLKGELEKTAVECGIMDSVKFMGFLNYQDYLDQMRMADIFLHPSVIAENGDSEGGAPTTILEAQALGLPVISTYHSDIPNITLPGKSALLSPERDSTALSANIIRLLEDGSRWEEMGKAGRQFVEAYHDIDKEVYKLESIYRELI